MLYCPAKEHTQGSMSIKSIIVSCLCCESSLLAAPPQFSEAWVVLHANQGVSLTGGLSDRNKVFEVDREKYVLHTLENDSELHMMIEVGEKGVGPKVLASFPEKQLVLKEYIKDSTITPELAQHHCKEIGRSLKVAHEIPLLKEEGEGFEKANRTRWEYIQTQAAQQRTELSSALLREAEEAMHVFEKGMKSLHELNSDLQVNLHTDLHPRNLFWSEGRFLMIDWESCSHGHPYFDLASLSIFLGLDRLQEKELLEGYFGRAPTSEQLQEYTLVKRIRWAYTSMVNTMWAFRVMEKEPVSEDIKPPERSFKDCMQFFAETDGMPPLNFFVDVSRLAHREALLGESAL